mgnify:CR=1 FL=1
MRFKSNRGKGNRSVNSVEIAYSSKGKARKSTMINKTLTIV